ncbi:MAG: malectin domain-containing carbohydrate-binding protein [candidate division KSB1 bacterium]|nr:malectin domain-containing carbohydrate-binding protein [candidate division KSB1 bacterium]
MNKRYFPSAVILTIMTIFIFSSIALSQTHITSCLPPGENPFTPMNIFVAGVTYNGQDLDAGDEIGVFGSSEPGECVGAALFTAPVTPDEPIEIIATNDDGTGCGFVQGDTMLFKLWLDDPGEFYNVKQSEIQFYEYETGVSLGDSSVTFDALGTTAVVITIGGPSFTLTTAVDPGNGGAVDPAAGTHQYPPGDIVDIAATPATGFQFVNWTGDVQDPNIASTTVTMDGDKTVTANFTTIQHQLTIQVDPGAGGTTVPSAGFHTYGHGSIVNVTATPEAGYVFLGWTGDVADPANPSTQVTMDDDKVITANFQMVQYTLEMSVDPPLGGTTTPTVGNHSYASDQQVNISAVAATGYQFVSWTGDVADPNSPSTTILMNGDKNVVANFATAEYTLTISVNPFDGGSTSPAVGAYTYPYGTNVPLSATPGNGFDFVNWTGDVANPSNANTMITMDGNKFVEANFALAFGSAEWSGELNISSGTAPDLDIDHATGHLHIVSLNNGVVYTKTDALGNVIVQENVPGTAGIPGEGYFGATVAVDNNGDPHVCYRTDEGNFKFNIYYVYKTGSGWSSPLLVSDRVTRGYMVRMDIDSQNRVHIVRGSAVSDVFGPVKYYRIENGVVVDTQDNLTSYRADDRVEIDASYGDQLQIILGCPNPNGGPVTYWRSLDGGDNINTLGDIHDGAAIDRNGCPDVFTDASGIVHICYGAAKDTDVNNKPSVRYSRWQNGSKVKDVTVTNEGDCIPWKQDQGIASIASSANGQIVAVAYTHTDGGDLYSTFSMNSGTTWEDREFLAANCGGAESRDKHVIRATGNRFYLVYPVESGIKLRFISFSNSNDQAPVADAGGPYYGDAGFSVTLDGSASYDDIGIVGYSWNFGDGQTGTGQLVNHVYAADNVYTATLTVVDSSGQISTSSTPVFIGNALSDVWSSPIQISSGDTPDLDIHKGTGNLHLLVMKNGVTYFKLDRYGNVVLEENVPGAENDEGMMRFGASIAVDSQDYPHIGYRVYRSSNRYDLYYTYKSATGWSTPLKIGDNVLRGYVVRLAADSADRIYYCHSSVTDVVTNTGPVHMYVLQNGAVIYHQDNIDQTRGDERYEVDVSDGGFLDLIAGDLSYPSSGGPIYYWRSNTPGGQLGYMGDFHNNIDARPGENGSPDVFVDDVNGTHVCYGVAIDQTVDKMPSLRYLRFSNGGKVRDVRVTRKGELDDWKFKMGIGSIAASADGENVVAAYLVTEDGELRTRLSQDGGATWGDPVALSDGWDCAESRNKHVIRANGNTFYLVYPEDGIKLRILGTPQIPQPNLSVSPAILDFQNIHSQLQLEVRNSGSGTLNWSVSNVASAWVTNVQPQVGSLGTGQSQMVTVTVDRSGLGDGGYNDILAVSSNGGNINIPIEMDVGGPSAWRINCGGPAYVDNSSQQWVADQAYTAGSFGYVGGDPYSTSDPIGNTNDDVLYQSERYGLSSYRFTVPNGDYEVELHFAEIYHNSRNTRLMSVTLEGTPVLTNLDIFDAAGHDAALVYNFNTRDLGVSVVDGRLDIGFVNVKDQAKISAIYVTKMAPQGPVFSINPASLDFGRVAVVETLVVRNSGESQLQWNLGSFSSSWVTSVLPQSGTLSANTSENVYVTINRAGLSEGFYNAVLPFNSNAGGKNVSVSMEVHTPAPNMALTPTDLNYGYFSTSLSVELVNTGDLPLTWEVLALDRPAWIASITPGNGVTAPGNTQQVTIIATRNGLAAGTHNGVLHFSSDGGNIDVNLSIKAGDPNAWRVNCGGPAYVDKGGDLWMADQPFNSNFYGYVGGDSYATADPIANTDDDSLYQSERYGMTAYRFNVPNGDYRIKLHFAEIYHQSARKRKINVQLEGDPIVEGLDIYSAAGHDAAYVLSFNTQDLGLTVTDGRIDLEFSANKDLPKISAIEVAGIASSGPQMVINPTTLSYGSTALNDTFKITNTGGSALNWQVQTISVAWISGVQPMNGALNPGQSVDVIVSINRAGLAEGVYVGVLNIGSNAGGQNVELSMSVQGSSAQMSVTPASLTFLDAVNSLNLLINNTGQEILNWQISTAGRPSWVSSVTPSSGSLLAGESAGVTVAVDRTGMTNGTYNGSLSVTSNGGNVTVPVQLQVGSSLGWRINCGGPQYTSTTGKQWSADKQHTAGSFGYVGGDQYSTTSSIANTTNDVLYQSERYRMTAYRFDVPNGDYQIKLHFAEIYFKATNRRVMSVNLEGTTVVQGLDIYKEVGRNTAYVVTLSTSALGLTISDGRIDLTFSSSKDLPKISAIEVTPDTPAGPALTITPVSLDLGSANTSGILSVMNSGGSSLTWQLGTITTAWITDVQPASGTLAAGVAQNVTVTIDRSGESEGSYTGVIPFTSNAGNQNVEVKMNVTVPGPELTLSTPSLEFGYFANTLYFDVSNTGDLPLSWNIPATGRAAWISSVLPESGTLAAGSSATVNVMVNRTGLAEGTYSDILTILSDGGNSALFVKVSSGDLRINAGGPALTDITGAAWQADQPYSSGEYGYTGGNNYQTLDPIANTDLDPIYQTERWGMTTYQIDASNQDYFITLHLAEIYYSADNKRIMSVSLEGTKIVSDLDIFAQAGHDAAMTLTFSTRSLGLTISDGRIDLAFSHAKDAPKISGIEVRKDLTVASEFAANSGTLDEEVQLIPQEYKLWQNYPNPFNNATVITFDLPEESMVDLRIFNLLGQQIVTLVNESRNAGTHQIHWNGLDEYGNDVPTGVYVCVIQTGEYRKTMKMMLMK